jgi:hypothetical protein
VILSHAALKFTNDTLLVGELWMRLNTLNRAAIWVGLCVCIGALLILQSVGFPVVFCRSVNVLEGVSWHFSLIQKYSIFPKPPKPTPTNKKTKLALPPTKLKSRTRITQ